jgi:hypothetical protein
MTDEVAEEKRSAAAPIALVCRSKWGVPHFGRPDEQPGNIRVAGERASR